MPGETVRSIRKGTRRATGRPEGREGGEGHAMRVGRERAARSGRADGTRGKVRGEGVRAGAFQDALRLTELEREAELDQALTDVDEAAERLRQEADLPALHRYKLALKAAFAAATRNAYKVHVEAGFGAGGRRRLLYVVRVVDEKLAELAELLVEQERDNVAIAARLDEIRGLLLDFYQ